MRRFWGFLLSALIVGAPGIGAAATESLSSELRYGVVVKVADGDTFTMKDDAGRKFKVRLYGVDSPEKAQEGGKEAWHAASQLLMGKSVTVRVEDTDRYGRLVGIVQVNDVEGASGSFPLQDQLILSGHAWIETRYCKQRVLCADWTNMEKKARAERVGLWGKDGATPPWQYRAMKRNAR